MNVWPAARCSRVLTKDGRDYAREDQPKEARQARHHQDMVRTDIFLPCSRHVDIAFHRVTEVFRSSSFYFFSEEILNPSIPMALRLSGILMGT